MRREHSSKHFRSKSLQFFEFFWLLGNFDGTLFWHWEQRWTSTIEGTRRRSTWTSSWGDQVNSTQRSRKACRKYNYNSRAFFLLINGKRKLHTMHISYRQIVVIKSMRIGGLKNGGIERKCFISIVAKKKSVEALIFHLLCTTSKIWLLWKMWQQKPRYLWV